MISLGYTPPMDTESTLLTGPSTASYLLRLPPALKTAAEKRAVALGLTFADVARLALACYLEPERLLADPVVAAIARYRSAPPGGGEPSG